jgi:iron complex transport system ATP-binding protein
MIDLDAVTVRFDQTVVLDALSMSVEPGEWVGLIGPNGAGKTSLLRAVSQLERYSGRISVGGRLMKSLAHRERARLVAYLPQSPELPSDMTVAEYVLLGRTPHIGYFRLESASDRRACDELLERLELTALSSRRLATLSGGEMQRVLLARALAQEAPVLLLDEPTSALDLGRRVDALDLLDDLRKERGLTILAALHDLTLAAEFATRLVLLSGGGIAASGPPAAVLRVDTLSAHFGGAVRVLLTDDGDVVVAPRARREG